MPETVVRVVLPEMGESVTEGSIVEWRVKPGQWIDEGATLVDVTTDKVDVEVPAPAAGVVTAVHAAEGATVPVGAALAEIDTAAEKPAGGAAPEKAGAPAPSAVVSGSDPGAGAAATAQNGAAKAAAPPNGARPGSAASYRARRLAVREGLDLGRIAGSGPGGLIVLADVERAGPEAAKRPLDASPPLPPPPAGAKVVPLKGPAATLAGYMDASLAIPTATSFRTFGVAVLERKRAELNAALKAAGRPEKISYTHLIAYALVRAAAGEPAMTTSFRRDDGVPYRVENGVNLGLAVDAERKDGSRFLVVPVIKAAAALGFADFRRQYEDLVARARDGKLGADDLAGASITLTNPGGIGTVASVPRLMAGQAAIVAAGAIGYPPGFTHAGDAALRQLGVEKIVTLTSTYDHRVIQGAQSGEFLKAIDELLQGNERFYDDVFASLGLEPGRVEAARPAAQPVTVSAAQAVEPREFEAYSDELLRAVAAGMAIVSAYRRHGHLAAALDPLGTRAPGDPALDPQSYGLTPAIMSAVPAAVLRTKLRGSTLAEIVPELRRTYGSTIAYEVEHIANIEQREWLRDYIETGKHVAPLSAERARRVLERLTKVETFERYLRKTYLGQKTFSIEGLDILIPMMEQLVTDFADDHIGTAFIGMAHRGRLATITHVVNRPYDEILREFDAADRRAEGDDADATGDVKYHHGADGRYVTLDGREIEVKLASNPSHLEAVDGVVEGRTRARQTNHDTPQATLELRRAAPLLVHGDAAFSAQGVVAEVLNLQGLAGYATGGTIHLIANNQVGFTTDPRDARSTRYASDLAKGFDVPIVHVNADDVEACMAAVQLAVDFRRRFGHDAIIDLIGYRRFGHNEADEPAYTQPEMYERIKAHPTVRELYAQKLMAQGVVSTEDVNALQAAAGARIVEAHKHAKSGAAQPAGSSVAPAGAEVPLGKLETGIPKERLLDWSRDLLAVPADFTVHPKLLRQLERRRDTFANEGEADWGLAESLAFASLLGEGTPIRLTGQDSERGTFSHRHLVLHDPSSNRTYTPLGHLPGALRSFEVYNSPLSEYACLGFEYGYSVETPDALVLWEAQFGDFMNGAQIIIDQFIAAGQAKWDERSRLVLLLPHGYEGAGPEHSSARIERFLQLSAEGNLQVVNCSTAAQYFHVLRHQARNPRALPLVIATPKSLLRLRAASGSLEELSAGRFRPVIDDERFAGERGTVERILMCSGKIYYDLTSHAAYANMRKTAIVRLELLAPLPVQEIIAVLDSYPNVKRLVWVQEEPKNMGARAHVRRRLLEKLPARYGDVGYVGRPYRASPSEGYGGAHAVEQERIVKEALTE